MAYSSSRGPARGAGPSRGSSRGGSGGGGGNANNTIAYVVAIAVVGLIIGLVVMMSGKKEAPKPPPAPPPPAPTVPVKPAAPAPPPYPTVSAAKLEEGRKLAGSFDGTAATANKLYDESIRAKKDGDDALWQKKLKDARGLLEGIKDQWNEFIATLPSSKDYDEEAVARHYFEREGGKVTQLIKKLAAMKSDER